MTDSLEVARPRAITRPGESTAINQRRSSSTAYSASEQEWDDFVASHPLGHHEQSSQHAQTRWPYGFGCARVTARRDGRVAGGAQVLTQRTPIGTYATVSCGPLAVSDDTGIMAEVIDQLQQQAREKRWSSLRVNTLLPHDSTRQALDLAGFRQDAAWCGPHVSLVNALDCDDEQMLAAMSKKHRYHIRWAERTGVSVAAGDADSVAAFAELHRLTAEHHGFPCHTLDYFAVLWNLFGTRGRAQHFVAYYNRVPVAGAFNTIVGTHMLFGWGGLRREPEYLRLMASYLVHVSAMRWARDHGCTHYDFSGNSPFKRKFGGREMHWPAPHRKYFGHFAGMRRSLAGLTRTSALLRRTTECSAARLGLRPRMPN